MGAANAQAPLDGSRPVEIAVLGGFTASVDGRRLGRGEWGRISAERLVKLLAVTPDHRMSREIAAETLWPDFAPEAGRANLRKAVHFARRAVGANALASDVLQVWLDPDLVTVDLDRLRTVLGGAGRGTTSTRAPEDPDRLAMLIDLGAGDLLPDDLYEDWLVGPRERLRELWTRAALQQASTARDAGRLEDAHALADLVLERDPTDEEAHRLAIGLFLLEGRHHAARRQLQLCRTVLRAELGVEPAPETVALLRSAEQTTGPDRIPAQTAPPLVGRHAELAEIEMVLDRLSAGEQASLLLRGPAGIGKSRLMQDVIAYGRASGWRIAQLQPVETMATEAFGPLGAALGAMLEPSEVARWPEPARSGVRVLAPGLGRHQLAFQSSEALGRAVMAGIATAAKDAPLVLAVDDLPWLDTPTVDLLVGLVASTPPSRVLVVATCRDDEQLLGPVARLVDALSRPPRVAISLGPLKQRDLEPLVVGAFGGRFVSADASRALYEHTGGNPLFCLETVRAARDRGGLRLDDGRWTLLPGERLEDVPDSARALASRRTASLPADARALLDVAAELGPVAPFDVLAAAQPVAEDALLPAIDAALASGLLLEQGSGYAFAHPLYRAAVRRATGVARRGAIHLAIARALARAAADGGRSPQDGPETTTLHDAAWRRDPAWLHAAAARCTDPALVADHAVEAADLGRREADGIAATFGLAAGRRAMAVHNRPDALRHLEQAIASWRRLPAADPSAWGIVGGLNDLGRTRALASSWDAATDAFREAVSLARSVTEITETYYDFADSVPYRRGDFDAARGVIREGLARLPQDALPARARLLAVDAWCLARARRVEEALPIARDAYESLGERPDPRSEIRVLDTLAMTLHYARREPERQTALLERARAVAIASGDSTWEAITSVHLGTIQGRAGQPAEAKPRTERGMELAHLIGDAYLEAIAAWSLAEIAEALGDLPGAVTARERELRLLAATGGNRHNEALAHAHLAHLHRLLGDDPAANMEADAARQCAAVSTQPGYADHIERAIACSRWSEVEI